MRSCGVLELTVSAPFWRMTDWNWDGDRSRWPKVYIPRATLVGQLAAIGDGMGQGPGAC